VPAIAPSELPIAEREALFRDGMVIDGATPHRLILFTFDDGPDRRSTPLLLDRLDAAGVKAVFFLTANRIASRTPMEREHATIAREILARGHIIGNHTLDHLQLPLLDDTGVAQQLGGAEDVFQNVLGIHPSLLRPPGGARSPRIDELLAQRGYTTVLWNLSTGDDQVRTAREVFDVWVKVMERREREDGERGGIVLLHDTNSWSVDAFQMIWGELMARNCKLLARGEELYDVVPDPSFFYQPRGDAPAGFVAAAAAPDAQVLAERQARLRVDAAQRCAAIDGF
jgi:peptidoglycan/xylan/chitin deacetylase (PgdA/CDA1 family)